MAAQLKRDIENIEFDLSELSSLEVQARRPHVKALIAQEVQRLTQEKTQLLTKWREALATEAAAAKESTTLAADGSTASGGQSMAGSVTVTNYMWDQTDDFVKVYIETDKTLADKDIDLSFANKRSFSVVFGKYRFGISRLFADIDTDKSHYKRTKSATKLIIYLKKLSAKKWSEITEKENQFKKALEEKDEEMTADPSAGLMRLMKQMYEEGDDDMKRTIAKSWYESRNNKSSDIDMKGDYGL